MRFPTRPSTRSLLQYRPEAGRSFRLEGGGLSPPPALLRRRGNSKKKRGCQWSGKSSRGSPLTELDGETSLSMITKIMEWVPITTLLIVVSWRPFASYQLPLDFVVCSGSVTGVLALFFMKH